MNNKPLRNPNGHGSVTKLKGRRRNPWMARVTTGWETAIATKGKRKGQEIERQLYQIIGYFETKSDAIDALALHRISPAPAQQNITLGELYEEWSAGKYKNVSRATANNYKAAWLYLKRLERAKFRDLRTSHWQAVIDECGMGRSTLEKIRSVAVMLNKYAMQQDIINKNYAEYISLPKTAKTSKQTFSDLDIKTMRAKAREVPWLDTVLIMIYTGMRISELIGLTRFNVDLKARIIAGGVKTDAGKDRIIPINSKIYPYIKAWHAKGGDALICREDGSKMPTKYYREQYYYPALEQAGIQKLTPHACRHTFASLMAKAGADPLYTQRLIGHADYAFTANAYTHPEVAELRKAINKI